MAGAKGTDRKTAKRQRESVGRVWVRPESGWKEPSKAFSIMHLGRICTGWTSTRVSRAWGICIDIYWLEGQAVQGAGNGTKRSRVEGGVAIEGAYGDIKRFCAKCRNLLELMS